MDPDMRVNVEFGLNTFKCFEMSWSRCDGGGQTRDNVVTMDLVQVIRSQSVPLPPASLIIILFTNWLLKYKITAGSEKKISIFVNKIIILIITLVTFIDGAGVAFELLRFKFAIIKNIKVIIMIRLDLLIC